MVLVERLTWGSCCDRSLIRGPMCVSPFVFFFQAEDGIRDYKVTGVQTCALPISRLRGASERLEAALGQVRGQQGPGVVQAAAGGVLLGDEPRPPVVQEQPEAGAEIGRASCRERV